MINVKDLIYTYPSNDTPSVKGISFSVEKGEIFGFLGPSGSGKSTTQKILIRLLKGFQGEVTIMDKKLQLWGSDYYNHIGVGFELPNHYLKLTGMENLRFFASFYNKPVADPVKLLEMVHLENDANKKVADYSKGMKMRLNFVRALLHNPEILFLDEPTSGLDPVNAKVLKDIILDLKKQGKTIFITTHNMQDAGQLCDKIAFMVEGELKLTDTPANLKERTVQHRTVKVSYLDEQPVSREFELDTLQSNEAFFSILRTYPVQSIHSSELSLEEVFINVTGKKLS